MLTGLLTGPQCIRSSLSQVMCFIQSDFARGVHVVFIIPSFSVTCIGNIFQPPFDMSSIDMPHNLAYVKNLGTTDFFMVELDF